MSQHDAGITADASTRPASPNGPEGTTTCSACGVANRGTSAQHASEFVYAIGRIEPRFPRQSVEKEYAQVVARSETKGLTDRQARHKILSQPENRYLARLMCWIFTVEGLETYLLAPRDPTDLNLLVESLRADPSTTDVDVVIGATGPIASPDACNGLELPIVIFDQIYSFDVDALLQSIPKPKEMGSEIFKRASAELLEKVMQLADNNGSADRHRAINYLTVRYPVIYAKVADAIAKNCSLRSVDTVPSRLSGARKIVDVIFSFVDRGTDVTEKCFVRIDVSDEFPFLVTKLSQYYDR
jgi:hypothetical protein